MNTSNWLYRVREFNGTILVVGEKGTLLTSINGVDWTPRATGTSRWLTDVAKVGEAFFICGHQGALLTSTDLASWKNIGTITEKSLFTLAHNNGRLLAAGVEGAILRAQVLPDTTPIQILNLNRVGTNNIFLFAGEPDQRFTLNSSPDLTRWTAGQAYEFLDSSGTLIIVEETGTNAPPRQFYRGTLIP